MLVLVGLFVADLVLQIVAAESGEVVVLSTQDAEGSHETRLWVVEHDDDLWLRSSSTSRGWHQRLEADPTVTVQRGNVSLPFRARAEVDRRAAINDLMRRKYGWADEYFDMRSGHDDAIPLRLIPIR